MDYIQALLSFIQTCPLFTDEERERYVVRVSKLTEEAAKKFYEKDVPKLRKMITEVAELSKEKILLEKTLLGKLHDTEKYMETLLSDTETEEKTVEAEKLIKKW